MMVNLQIRDERPSDQDAIRDVTLAAYQEYAVQWPGHWENYRQNILNTLADVTPAEQIVAEQNGTILGTILLYPPRLNLHSLKWPEVRLLAVAPSGRGHGLGRILMEECVERARASGSAILTLHTTDLMQKAVHLYRRMGFIRTPESDFHLAPGLTIKGYQLDLEHAIQ